MPKRARKFTYGLDLDEDDQAAHGTGITESENYSHAENKSGEGSDEEPAKGFSDEEVAHEVDQSGDSSDEATATVVQDAGKQSHAYEKLREEKRLHLQKLAKLEELQRVHGTTMVVDSSNQVRVGFVFEEAPSASMFGLGF